MPPAGLGPPPRTIRIPARYAGPPRYGPWHPTWGFPPVAKLRPAPGSPEAVVAANAEIGRSGHGVVVDARSVRRWLTAAVVTVVVAGVACAVAAVAEAKRFALLLDGRAAVLPAGAVRASDIAVAFAAAAALLCGVIALLTGVAAACRLYRAAVAEHGMPPARSDGQIAARLLVPGWNVYGVGQIVTELIALVFSPLRGRGRVAPRAVRRLLAACWSTWALGGLLGVGVVVASLLAALPGRWAGSLQAAANLVEAHVVLDALAGLTAVLFAALIAVLRREWCGARVTRQATWTIAPPASSPRNQRPVPAAGDQPICETTPDSTGVASSASTTSAT